MTPVGAPSAPARTAWRGSREGILPYKFEIYRGQDGLFYWRFKASNGDVMVSSDPYTTKSSAKHAIESMQANASDAIIEDKL